MKKNYTILFLLLLLSLILGACVFSNTIGGFLLSLGEKETNEAQQESLVNHQDGIPTKSALSEKPTSTPSITIATATELQPSPTLDPPTATSIPNRFRENDNMELVFVPAGEFRMGTTMDIIIEVIKQSSCPDCFSEWYSAEVPENIIYVDDFWIDKYEVNNAQYANFLNKTKHQSIDSITELLHISDNYIYFSNLWEVGVENAELPVRDVTWKGATEYCSWVGGRLPTEAEWEKAARGTDGRLYPWGNEIPLDESMLNYNNFIRHSVPVNMYEDIESPYGTVNMAGNVWEWTADYFHHFAYQDILEDNPSFENYSPYVTIRGGSNTNHELDVRVTRRGKYNPFDSGKYVGFRCVVP